MERRGGYPLLGEPQLRGSIIYVRRKDTLYFFSRFLKPRFFETLLHKEYHYNGRAQYFYFNWTNIFTIDPHSVCNCPPRCIFGIFTKLGLYNYIRHLPAIRSIVYGRQNSRG